MPVCFKKKNLQHPTDIVLNSYFLAWKVSIHYQNTYASEYTCKKCKDLQYYLPTKYEVCANARPLPATFAHDWKTKIRWCSRCFYMDIPNTYTSNYICKVMTKRKDIKYYLPMKYKVWSPRCTSAGYQVLSRLKDKNQLMFKIFLHGHPKHLYI